MSTLPDIIVVMWLLPVTVQIILPLVMLIFKLVNNFAVRISHSWSSVGMTTGGSIGIQHK